MDNLETKALNIIMRLEKRKEVQKIAAYILTNAVKVPFNPEEKPRGQEIPEALGV